MKNRRKKQLFLSIMVSLIFVAVIWGIQGDVKKESETEAAGIAKVVIESAFTPHSEIVTKERFWCGETISKKISAEPWLGRKVVALYDDYPPEDGWEIYGELPEPVEVARSTEDFCPKHQPYRHLGIDGDKLAIYQGPLGHQRVLLQVEDIFVSDLPSGLQNNLKQAEKFKELSSETQKRLQAGLEFADDASLNAYLDNLDEFYRE